MIIPKIIKLSKDDWSVRLQREIFPNVPRFNNYCPHFWLTGFCIIAACFVFPVRWLARGIEKLPDLVARVIDTFAPVWTFLAPAVNGFCWVVEKFFMAFEVLVDRLICMPLDAMDTSNMSDQKLIRLYEKSAQFGVDHYGYDKDYAFRWLLNDADSKRERTLWAAMSAKFDAWASKAGPDWKTQLEEAQKREAERSAKAEADRRALENARYAAQQKAEAERKAQINSIVIWTKRLFPVFIGALGLFLCWVVWTLIALLHQLGFFTFAWSVISAVPGFVLGIVVFLVKLPVVILRFVFSKEGAAIIGTVVATAAVIVVVVKKAPSCTLLQKDIEMPNFIVRIGDWILNGAGAVLYYIGQFFRGIGTFFKLVKEGIVMFKKDNCPQIEWES